MYETALMAITPPTRLFKMNEYDDFVDISDAANLLVVTCELSEVRTADITATFIACTAYDMFAAVIKLTKHAVTISLLLFNIAPL